MRKPYRAGIIGGAGYIGSHLILELLSGGHELYILDNLSTGDRINLPESDQVHFMEGDLLDGVTLHDFLGQKLDVVFHFAAAKAAGESMTNPSRYSEQNIRGTLAILEAMLAFNTMNLVFSSTAAVYGVPEYLPVDEMHPLEPENYYGFTKLVIEKNLNWLSKLKGLKFAALRYFNAAGYDLQGRIRGLEKNPANLMPVIMEVASGQRPLFEIFGTDYNTPDGSCIRDYIHVSDLARAHVLAMDYLFETKECLTVNLGTGRGLSVLEIYRAACTATNREIPMKLAQRRPGDPGELVASANLARKVLGWQARITDPVQILESMWRVYQS